LRVVIVPAAAKAIRRVNRFATASVRVLVIHAFSEVTLPLAIVVAIRVRLVASDARVVATRGATGVARA